MRRDQLELAIRTACQIIGRPEVIVVGSQAILGTFREDELPGQATMSSEIDILPIADSNEETVHLADRTEGVAGALSPFEQLHGFSIDGVDLQTSALPESWRDRLVKVQNANTAGACWRATVHWLVPRQGRSLRCEVVRISRPSPTSSSRCHLMTLALFGMPSIQGFPRPMHLRLSQACG
jgi:hypothetical protein